MSAKVETSLKEEEKKKGFEHLTQDTRHWTNLMEELLGCPVQNTPHRPENVVVVVEWWS